MVAIPVYVRHNISLKPGTTGRVELTVGPKQSMGKVVGLFGLTLILPLMFLLFIPSRHNEENWFIGFVKGA